MSDSIVNNSADANEGVQCCAEGVSAKSDSTLASITNTALAEESLEQEVSQQCGDDSCEDLYEEVQVTYTEDDIVCYLSDDDDKIIGFVLLDEEGCEVEHFYAEDCNPFDENKKKTTSNDNDEIDLGITSDGVAHAKDDLIDIYKEGKVIAHELQDTLKEINELLDFKSFLNPK